jgi:hypothetical protein
LLSFSLIVGGQRRVENKKERVVLENASKSTSRLSMFFEGDEEVAQTEEQETER